jgi:hypothetical protein
MGLRVLLSVEVLPNMGEALRVMPSTIRKVKSVFTGSPSAKGLCWQRRTRLAFMSPSASAVWEGKFFIVICTTN